MTRYHFSHCFRLRRYTANPLAPLHWAVLILGVCLAHMAQAQTVTWGRVTAAAPWGGRLEPGCIVFSNQIWMLGGAITNYTAYAKDVWSTADGFTWTKQTGSAPWAARKNHAAASFQGQMWVFGGVAASGYLNDIWSSLDGTNWTQATTNAAWSARQGMKVTVYNGKLWLTGGHDGAYLNDVWSSSDGTNWTLVTAHAEWTGRYQHAAEAANGKMWVIAGSASFTEFHDVWSSTNGVTWTLVTGNPPWGQREDFSLIALDGKLWLLDGYNSGSFYNDVWSSIDGTNWTQAIPSSPWTARRGSGAVAFNGGIWLLGGDSGSPYLNDVWLTTGDLNGFAITSIHKEGNDIRVAWLSPTNHTYVVQSTRSTATSVGYNANFVNVSPTIVVASPTPLVTNFLDVAAAYTPVLFTPTQAVPTSGAPSTVNSSAQSTRGIADSFGNALPIGAVVYLGTFGMAESVIQSNFMAGNTSAILSNFTPYAAPFAVGDGIGLPATWSVSRDGLGQNGQKLYLLVIDTPAFATAGHLGIFTAPAWTVPSNGGTNTVNLEDATTFVIGSQGGSLTIGLPLNQTYTFSDTARLSALPGRSSFYRVRLVQ